MKIWFLGPARISKAKNMDVPYRPGDLRHEVSKRLMDHRLCERLPMVNNRHQQFTSKTPAAQRPSSETRIPRHDGISMLVSIAENAGCTGYVIKLGTRTGQSPQRPIF